MLWTCVTPWRISIQCKCVWQKKPSKGPETLRSTFTTFDLWPLLVDHLTYQSLLAKSPNGSHFDPLRIWLGDSVLWKGNRLNTQETEVNLRPNLLANPSMLLVSCVNTPIDHIMFHYLRPLVVKCSASCANWALRKRNRTQARRNNPLPPRLHQVARFVSFLDDNYILSWMNFWTWQIIFGRKVNSAIGLFLEDGFLDVFSCHTTKTATLETTLISLVCWSLQSRQIRRRA